jgi:hypothetical protein
MVTCQGYYELFRQNLVTVRANSMAEVLRRLRRHFEHPLGDEPDAGPLQTRSDFARD